MHYISQKRKELEKTIQGDFDDREYDEAQDEMLIDKINKTHEITIPTVKGIITVEMSNQDLIDFHDALTIYYNKNFIEITKDENLADRPINQERD